MCCSSAILVPEAQLIPASWRYTAELCDDRILTAAPALMSHTETTDASLSPSVCEHMLSHLVGWPAG